MTYPTAVPILFASFVYRTNVYWSVIHGIKRKPHLSVVWNWYHYVAIAILHQPRPTDSADINMRLQLSGTSSIPPMHGGFLLLSRGWIKMFDILNKANLRDLIAATALAILLKLDSNRRFLSPCDVEIWWMTPKNNRAPLLCYFKLFASFHSHWWIQTGVTVLKHPIWVKFNIFLAVWPRNLTDDLEKQ